MAGSHGACALALTTALLLGLLTAASGAGGMVIMVGGDTGWTTGFSYDAWALAQNIQLHVGDSLVFKNPDSETHTVAMVNTVDEYQSCILGGAFNVTPISPGSSVTVVIPSTLEGQTLYVVCTIAGHCTENQKIKGKVLAAEANGPSPTPSPSGTPNPGDAERNRILCCWTTAILLLVACLWSLG